MKPNSRQLPTKRLHIERLELDLHGVAPHTAEAAVRLLGSALAQGLAGRRINVASTERMDLGRIALTDAAVAEHLAMQLVHRIVVRTSED